MQTLSLPSEQQGCDRISRGEIGRNELGMLTAKTKWFLDVESREVSLRVHMEIWERGVFWL